MPKGRLSFGNLRFQDGSQYVRLLENVFGKQRFFSLPMFEHVHFKNPLGESVIAGAWRDGELAGMTPMVQCEFWIRGKKHRGLHSCNSAVHPDHIIFWPEEDDAPQATFLHLLNSACEDSLEKGRFVYGFPNLNALRTLEKFGAKSIGRMDVHLEPHRLGDIFSFKFDGVPRWLSRAAMAVPQVCLGLKNAFRRRPHRGIEVAPVDVFTGEWDDFSKEMSKHYPVIRNRDAAFLTWRFKNNPATEYKIFQARKEGRLLGYLSCMSGPWPEGGQKTMPCGIVVDYLVPPGEPGARALYNLLGEARNYFLEQNIGMVSTISVGPGLLSDTLRKAGFFRAPDKVKPHPFHLVVNPGVTPENPIFAELTNVGHWFATLADNDIA